jgi:hypothetical protein
MKHPWTDSIDPHTIPYTVLASELGRRNALLRHSYTGGVFWRKHNPQVKACRCRECMARRGKNNP